ncbi:MAG: SDR family NAD(P)-dependent oxidoreductase [Rhizobiaceae bacterium]|nr:SDR family NAD(P)-dependent oxidoreductase [Rhizobiaceae bacterium]
MLGGKIAVVTGASRGIGYQSALTLARNGAHVIAIARTVGGLEELDDEIQGLGGTATLVPIDLLDYDAIDRLGASIFERWQKLDILVANAGMLGGLSPVEHIEPKTFEKIQALNVTANWRLICSLSPLLRESQAGRAVFMTSIASEESKPFWGGYATSQAALKSLVKTWAAECSKTSLRINLLDPGPMRTALRAAAMPGEDPDLIGKPAEISGPLLQLLMDDLQEHGLVLDRQTGEFHG